MQHLLATLRRLRAPDGCPWDREQTHLSLRPYLLEEAAEAVDAISAGDTEELRAELGDVLLQVTFHSLIGEEGGTFSYPDVERAIVDKLVRRHRHVFGDVTVADAGEVTRNWQAIKREERGGRERGVAEQIPASLGALAREAQAQRLLRGGRGGECLALELPGTVTPDEAGVGQLLAAVVAYARGQGVDPELALRAHTERRLREAEEAQGERA